MLKNIYTPLSGAIAQERVMEVVANNLANLNTAGFKGDNVSFTLLEPEPEKNYKDPIPPANYKVNFEDLMPLRGNEMSYVGVASIERDTTQGPAIMTENSLDLMLEGDGYFAVNTPEGTRYTRAGDLTMNADGALITKSGHPVMGDKGSIYLRSNAFEVNPRGEVYQDGQLIDRLQVYQFSEEKQLERVGNNYYFFDGEIESVQRLDFPAVRQGYVEGSNVNAMKNLTAMIIAHRSYEAYQKAVSNYDQMMDKSSNSIGVVRA